MTLHQLAVLKHWHVAHGERRPVELHAWNAMLTCWLMGWMGVPVALVLDRPAVLLLCAALFLAPGTYVRLRRRLHRLGSLRCDWLQACR